jgi:transposase-like protein
VTEVAERYGVSRQSVHAWLRRYQDEGPSGLAERSSTMVATQRIHVGMIHARKVVNVAADGNAFR